MNTLGPLKPMRERIGLSAALATPFFPVGDIDWVRFAAHARKLLAAGMNVVTAFGTTGEGASISTATRGLLYERMATQGVRSSQIVECVYGPAVDDVALNIKRSLVRGSAGILLPPPFYFKNVSDEGAFRWFAEVIEKAGDCRDIILYNLPQLTGVPVGPGLVARLRLAFPEVIAGVKDSGGDWDHTRALLAEHRDLAILVGHEGHLAAAVRQGATGAISGIANLAPALVAGLVRGEDDPRIEAVLELLLKLPVVPAIKAILAAQTGGETWNRLKAPLMPIDPVLAKPFLDKVLPLLA